MTVTIQYSTLDAELPIEQQVMATPTYIWLTQNLKFGSDYSIAYNEDHVAFEFLSETAAQAFASSGV